MLGMYQYHILLTAWSIPYEPPEVHFTKEELDEQTKITAGSFHSYKEHKLLPPDPLFHVPADPARFRHTEL